MGSQPAVGNHSPRWAKMPSLCMYVHVWAPGQAFWTTPSLIHTLSPPPTKSPTSSYQSPDLLLKHFSVWLVYRHTGWCKYVIFICIYQCLVQFVFFVGTVLCVRACGIHTCWHLHRCGLSSRWRDRNMMAVEHLYINTTYTWYLGGGGMSVGLLTNRVLFCIGKGSCTALTIN